MKEMSYPPINQRIKKLINLFGDGSVRKFSQMINLPSSQRLNRLFNIDKRNNKYPVASSDILTAITNTLKEVDANWLFTGEGTMLKNDTVNQEKQNSQSSPFAHKITTKERLIKFIKFEQLSIFGFEKVCGLSNGYINNIRVSIGEKTLEKIVLKFPQLNPVWLMMGEGNMLKGDANAPLKESINEPASESTENNAVNERILSLIDFYELNVSQMAKKLEVAPTVINNIIKGRKSKPSYDLLVKIIGSFDQINSEWLITGEGPMLKSDADSAKIDVVAESKPSYIKNSNGNTYKDLKNGRYIVSAPVVPFYAYGRYLSDFADEAFMTELDYVEFIVDHIGRGKYVSFEIKGDSMDDGSKRSVPERSLVLCREVKADYWKDKLHYRKFPYWIIVHKTSILCKQIINHNVEKGTIKCHSLNPSPEYQDFEISLNEVKQLLNIIKIQKDVEWT